MITFKQFMSESINDKGIFKAIFIVGIPGAGKSYTASRLKGIVSPVIVNTDKSAEHLAKKWKIRSTPENWEKFFKDKTHKMTRSQLKNYINGMLPLFIDGTSQDASNILHRMGILESLGYDVGVIHVKSNLELAKQRAKEREKEIPREVDVKFIEDVDERNEDNVRFLKSKVGFFIEVDNTEGKLDDAALMRAFKKTQSFYSSSIKNPIAKRAIADIQEGKGKYLVPLVATDEELDNKIQGWYR